MLSCVGDELNEAVEIAPDLWRAERGVEIAVPTKLIRDMSRADGGGFVG